MFLKIIASQTEQYDIRKLIKEASVDVKFKTFLVEEKYIIKVGGDIVKPNPDMLLIPEHVLVDFIKYRDTLQNGYDAKKKFDESLYKQIGGQPLQHEPYIQKIVDRAVDETKRKMAKDAAEYAEWAVLKGKSNIAEVVYKMLSL